MLIFITFTVNFDNYILSLQYQTINIKNKIKKYFSKWQTKR